MFPVMQETAADRAALEATGVAVGRGGAAVLAGVELTVRPGERVALVGANGSGKTSLLRVLAGLDRPLAGTVAWAGRALPPGPDRVRRVGVLLQGELASRFTVRELVTLGLGLDGPPSAAARRQVDAALALAELAPLAGRRCATLSGGEAQRALIARAVVAAPGLVLLDEPTNHLDPAGRAMIQALLDRLGGGLGGGLRDRRPGWSCDGSGGGLRDRGRVAAVIATHDLGLAASCDRVALLSAGRLVALGAPDAVLTPARLADALGAVVRRVEDPDGGPPLFRVVAPCRRGAPEVTACAELA
jgi:iron complex transport system ATP-binding protein